MIYQNGKYSQGLSMNKVGEAALEIVQPRRMIGGCRLRMRVKESPYHRAWLVRILSLVSRSLMNKAHMHVYFRIQNSRVVLWWAIKNNTSFDDDSVLPFFFIALAKNNYHWIYICLHAKSLIRESLFSLGMKWKFQFGSVLD